MVEMNSLQQEISLHHHPMADDDLRMYDWVELTGLVNAPHLNGQLGKVSQTMNANGRVAVAILGGDGEAKLLKRSNLRRIANDEDIPDIGFPKGDRGFVSIRIENGAGHTCVDCGCDLAGRYYVIDDDGQYYCECDYAEKHHDHDKNPVDVHYCVACYQYIPHRDGRMVKADAVRPIFPDGKLPNGRPYLCQDDPLNAYTHEACFHCALCSTSIMDQERVPHGYRLRAHHGGLVFLCAPAPGRTDGCDNDWEAYLPAKKRLTVLESMSVSELEALLQQRDVAVSQGQDMESLIRKVIVTDEESGRLVERVVGTGIHATRYTARVAYGAFLRDRHCKHGAQTVDATTKGVHDKTIHDGIMTAGTPFRMGDFERGFQATVDFWSKHLDLLRADVERRAIPRSLWAMAVTESIHEEGEFSFTLAVAAGSLIVDAMLNIVAEMSNFRNEDAQSLLDQPRLRNALSTISSGKNEIFLFMHHPDHRKCKCMAYLATAAEVGKAWNNLNTCAVCKESIVVPMRCSACKQVAYCGPEHQRAHWKTHKKTCAGRANS